MCLKLHKSWKKETAEYRNKKKPFIAYKILSKRNGNLYSLFLGDQWDTNEEQVSCRLNHDVQDREVLAEQLSYGLHLFVTEVDAEKWRNTMREAVANPEVLCMRRVEVKPENVVALGSFWKYRSMVVTACTMLEE